MTTTPTTRPELQDIPTGAFIAGEWRTLPRTFVVDTPYDSSDLAHVADCGPDEAREAIEAAVTAFATWKTDNFRRADIIARWADLIDANTERMARVMALEMGKPFTEAKGEVGGGVGYIRYYADAARHIAGERVPSRFAHKRGMTTSEAVGVVYAVTPWNFPMSMIARKAGPALAAGCTVVLKPAEQSPLTALLLAELWAQAGGPARVIGLSVGSQLALTLLAQRPDLIHSALLSGTLALPTRLGAWLSGPPNDLLTRLTWPAHTGPTTLTLQRLAMNLPARHAHHLARDARTVTRQTHLDLTRENLTYRPDPGLARTTVPVTLLVGSREHDILHRSARHLTQLLPLARAYRVPHMTHLWPLTHPQHYNAVLHAWLHGQPLPDALQPL